MAKPISIHEIKTSVKASPKKLRLFVPKVPDIKTAQGIFATNSRAAELDAKFRSGEKLSEEENAELDKFLKENMSTFVDIMVWNMAELLSSKEYRDNS